MTKHIKDQGMCEHCGQPVEVEEYGVKFPCRHCGKNNVFQPDLVLPVQTPYGNFQVGMPPAFVEVLGESIARNILRIGSNPESMSAVMRGFGAAILSAFFKRGSK
jgi:hypothetical protein